MAERLEDHEETTLPRSGGEPGVEPAVLVDLSEKDTPSRRFYANLADL